MIAQGYDDCEGDLMAEIRKIVGDKVIVGTELDLHGHLTDKMMDSANLLVFFKHYPHDDIDERADELYDLNIVYEKWIDKYNSKYKKIFTKKNIHNKNWYNFFSILKKVK